MRQPQIALDRAFTLIWLSTHFGVGLYLSHWRGHLGWPSPSQAAEALFGKHGRVRAIVDIPGQIDELIEKLPVQLGHSASSLIMRHTLFPYVTAFLEKDRRLKVGRQMRIVNGKPHQHLGPRMPGIDFVTHLRFCSDCATEMNNVHGETYWVRDHQLPSSLVCHLHGNMLVAGCAIPTAGRPAYVPAPSPLEMPNYSENEPNQKKSDSLLTLANLGTRVLRENGPTLAAEIKNRLHISTKATQSQVLSQFQQFIFPAFQAVNVKLDEDTLAAAFKPKMTAVPALYYLIASSLSDSNASRPVRSPMDSILMLGQEAFTLGAQSNTIDNHNCRPEPELQKNTRLIWGAKAVRQRRQRGHPQYKGCYVRSKRT